MKYRHSLNLMLIIILSLSLSGCVIYEQIRMKLNLSKRTGQIEYFNIVSAIEKEDSYWENDAEKEKFLYELKETRKKDLVDLLKEYDDIKVNSNMEVTSKKLVKKKNQLNGIEKFKYKSFKDFEIETSADGSSYALKLEGDQRYIDGNGFYFETDTGNYVSWSVDVKYIDITLKLHDLEDFDYVESLLPYWKEWKKTN
ncbi:MAG: hypothetical protein ABJ004_17480 [Cyclobacteriaceae bacterium]